MIARLSFAKSARANHTSAMSLFAVCVFTSILLPARVGEVVDVRRPAHGARHGLVGVERRGRLERVLRELVLHVAGCRPPLMSVLSRKKCDGEFCASTTVLPRRSVTDLTFCATHDAVAAVRPVDLLVDARHRARVLSQLLDEQRYHVERRPPDVHLARRVGVAHGDRVVDQHELELERLAARRLPDLAGLEAVVGVDHRRPSRPHVERHAHGVVDHRRVGRRALHLGQLGARDVAVLLDRRDAARVRRLGPALLFARSVGEMARAVAAAEAGFVPPKRETP